MIGMYLFQRRNFMFENELKINKYNWKSEYNISLVCNGKNRRHFKKYDPS